MLNATCAINMVIRPVSRLIDRKNEREAAPTTIAGAAMSANTMALMGPLPQKRNRPSARATGVPTITEMSDESIANSSEIKKACVRPLTCVRLRYQYVVKPFQAKVMRLVGALLKL